MKRTLSVLTAVLFAGAMAAPVMAQSAPTKSDTTVAQAEGAAPAAEPSAEATPMKHHHRTHHMRHHKKSSSMETPAAEASPAPAPEAPPSGAGH